MNIPTSISRKILWQYVNLKINRVINFAHVYSVIVILFDEMIKELVKGSEIKIFNFGTLKIKKTKPRMYFDINQRRMMKSKGNNNMYFSFSPKIRNKLCELIDSDKLENE